MVKTHAQQPITKVPLTAEAREEFIEHLFVDELPHVGEIFVPDDDFYYGDSPRKKTMRMTKILCAWLGIKPGYIGFEFELGSNKTSDEGLYTIYVESSVAADEFILGGFLAYALTRYLVEERKQIFLPEPEQQANLIASASIVFGLGLAIANGISPTYNWISGFRKRNSNLLKTFPVPNYSQMTLNYLRKYRIDQTVFIHCLTPWAAKRMGLTRASISSNAIRDVRHRIRVANYKIAGALWIIFLATIIGGYVSFQRVKPLPDGAVEASQKVEMYTSLASKCKNQLAYDRQYADASDIQSERALNAESVRCQSLQNMQDAASNDLKALTGQ